MLAQSPALAQTLDKVRFGTNWVAEAEHGGFYQALADGTYRKYGLDVTIVPGGPNVNNRILLPVGKLDFFMSANSLQSFDAVAHDIPTVTVAASFQKDPQVLIAHPGVEKLADLKKLTLFVSPEGMVSYFQWLRADYGFDEAKVKPYTFNAQPFLAEDVYKRQAVRKAPADALIVADGTSCRHQIRDGADRAALHVARVLAMSVAAGINPQQTG